MLNSHRNEKCGSILTKVAWLKCKQLKYQTIRSAVWRLVDS